jgi:hypothetical protein
VTSLLNWYARAIAIVGSLLLAIAPAFFGANDRGFWWTAGVSMLLTALLRWKQIPLTKYSALNLTGMVAVGASLLGGIAPAALGVAIGVVVADRFLLRKGLESAWINGGREAVALFAAYGFFAVVARMAGPELVHELAPEAVFHADRSWQAAPGGAVADPAVRGHRLRDHLARRRHLACGRAEPGGERLGAHWHHAARAGRSREAPAG